MRLSPPAPVDVIAHRGASAAAPEHTVAAYDLALRHGADVLELDVRVTRDGELLVVHDPTLLRTHGDPRAVAELCRADLRGLPFLLTLDAVLETWGRRARLLVELKDPTPAWERDVLARVGHHGLADRVVLQSFDARALRRLHAAAPRVPVAPLLRLAPSARRLRVLAGWAQGVGVRHAALDAATVARIHAAGLLVRAWTANAPADIDRLLRLGVDGVITDVPATAVALRAPVVADVRAA